MIGSFVVMVAGSVGLVLGGDAGTGGAPRAVEKCLRTVTVPPVREDRPSASCAEAPDDAAVLRALGGVSSRVPWLYEEFRDDIEIVTERLVDRIDPPRFYPLVGPARLHRCYWRCTVYYTDTIESSYPFPVRITRPRARVVYFDRDHLHLCGEKEHKADK
jgi:hypothetical protein